MPSSCARGVLWSPNVSSTADTQCISGAMTTGEPGALVRGGSNLSATAAGPLAVNVLPPSSHLIITGFRCAR